jgi:hypothetical protein
MTATDLSNLVQRIVAATGGKWALPKGLEYDCDRWWVTRATDIPTFTPIPTEWAEAIIERDVRERFDHIEVYQLGKGAPPDKRFVARHAETGHDFGLGAFGATQLEARAAALEGKA